MPTNQFYEEDDAEQILKLAAAKQGIQGRLSRENLLQTAAELGITPEAVDAAEQELASQKNRDEEMREFIIVQRNSFFGDVLVYLGVCGFLGYKHFADQGNLGWTVWLMLCWGVYILANARNAFDHRSKDFLKDFDKWKRKQREEGLPTTGSDKSVVIGVTVHGRRSRRHWDR